MYLDDHCVCVCILEDGANAQLKMLSNNVITYLAEEPRLPYCVVESREIQVFVSEHAGSEAESGKQSKESPEVQQRAHLAFVLSLSSVCLINYDLLISL